MIFRVIEATKKTLRHRTKLNCSTWKVGFDRFEVKLLELTTTWGSQPFVRSHQVQFKFEVSIVKSFHWKSHFSSINRTFLIELSRSLNDRCRSCRQVEKTQTWDILASCIFTIELFYVPTFCRKKQNFDLAAKYSDPHFYDERCFVCQASKNFASLTYQFDNSQNLCSLSIIVSSYWI